MILSVNQCFKYLSVCIFIYSIYIYIYTQHLLWCSAMHILRGEILYIVHEARQTLKGCQVQKMIQLWTIITWHCPMPLKLVINAASCEHSAFALASYPVTRELYAKQPEYKILVLRQNACLFYAYSLFFICLYCNENR